MHRDRMSPYPDMPDMRVSHDEEELPADWLALEIRRLLQSLADFTKLIEDTSNRVDEYQVQDLPVESVTRVQTTPDYDQFDEIITAIIVTGPTIAQLLQAASTPVSGNVTAPGAGATIVSVSLPAGTYNIAWETGLTGTPGAGDANNFQLTGGSASYASVNPGAVGGPYVQNPETIVLASTGTVAIKAIGAGTAGAVYAGQIVVTPVTAPAGTGTPFTIKLGRRVWNLELPPTGILVIAPISLNLNRNADRYLTSTIAGNWAIELTGYADVGYRHK